MNLMPTSDKQLPNSKLVLDSVSQLLSIDVNLVKFL